MDLDSKEDENEDKTLLPAADELVADNSGVVIPGDIPIEEELEDDEPFVDFDEEDFDDDFDDDFEEEVEGEYELPQDLFNEDFDGGALDDFKRKQEEKERKAREELEDG